MGVITQRSPADKDGEEIISSILTNKEAQIERGTYEINHHMDDRVVVIGSIKNGFVVPGEMVSVVIKGERKNALVVGYSSRVDFKVGVSSQIILEMII